MDQWKKNKTGETLRIPADKHNHHIDDVRYALEDDMERVSTFIA